MEELLLFGGDEAEQLQGVLAHVRVAAELRAAAFGGDPPHGLQREMDEVADPLDVEDHGIAALFQHHAG